MEDFSGRYASLRRGRRARGLHAAAPVRPQVAEPGATSSCYGRDHNVTALYTVTKENLDAFRLKVGVDFSKFKYGDPDSISLFAGTLADLIWERYGAHISARPDAWRIASPAYGNVPTAAVLLSEECGRALAVRYGVRLGHIHLERRGSPADDFGTLSSRDAREKHIFGNFSYQGPTLAGAHVLFVEDALVSGTHYKETQRVLEQEAGVACQNIHGCFVVDLRADTFGDERYCVEAILNHLWVSNGRVERLAEILKKPQVQITPRMLKMLLNAPWRVTKGILDLLEWPTVLSICHTARAEEMQSRREYSGAVRRVKEYAGVRLAAAKSRAGLKAVCTVGESSLNDFMRKRRLRHPHLGRDISLGEMYSLLKFGDSHAVEHFAAAMAEFVRADIGDRLKAEAGRWGVAAPGYALAQGSAGVLAERTAELLDLPMLRINRLDVPEVSYGKLNDARRRMAEVTTGEYRLEGARRENLILIEDAVVSGANSEHQCRLLSQSGSLPHPYALVNVTTADLAFEELLNTALVSTKSPGLLTEILRQPKTRVVMRTVKTLLTLAEGDLRRVLGELDDERCVEVFNIARRNGMDAKPLFGVGFDVLRECLNERLGGAKGLALPPYETLFVLTESNAGEFMPREGALYSGLKYGDPACVDYFSGKLAAAIRRRFGGALHRGGRDFVVAATHYFRVPNAASYLGASVARLLGLPVADVRRKKIYAGEFGALPNAGARRAVVSGNAYCSNPHEVEGREVIYVDDAVVSGSHLAEHCAALEAAGAAAVHPFAVFDVIGDLTLETSLNHARVRPDSPAELLQILRDPAAPTLTRSLKLLLRLPPEDLARALSTLPDDRVFDLWEGATLEAYGEVAELADNVVRLGAEAERRHAQFKTAEPVGRGYALMLFDYDDTLAPTLTPLSDEMADHLIHFLSRGVEVGIISLQPIGRRGLSEYLVEPLRRRLRRSGQDLSPLAYLHLLPSEGVLAYRVNGGDGSVAAAPVYNVGFQPSQWDEFERLVSGGAAARRAVRLYSRGGYISLHFGSEDDLRAASGELSEELRDFKPPVVLKRKKTADPGKIVLHVKLRGASKAVGRDYMLRVVRGAAACRLGRHIPRGEVLVVGDKLGVSAGEDDDAPMFVHGGVNVAVGSEARPGTCAQYLGRREEGTIALLRELRKWDDA